MGKSEWNNLDDCELDIVLTESVDELPTEEAVRNVVPCKNAMFLVLTGMTLRTIMFNFLYLDYILPVAGGILSLLGFRKLKAENMWFKFDYILSWIRTVCCITWVILNTMIIHNNEYITTAFIIVEGLLVGTQFAELVSLWVGIRAVQKKAGLVPGAYSVGILLGWYIVLMFLVGIKYRGVVLAIILTIVYGALLYTMSKLSKELDEAGYMLRAGSIKIEDKVMTAIFAGIIIVGCVCGYIFGDSYRMDWNLAENCNTESVIDNGWGTWKGDDVKNNVEKIKENLIGQGFPDYVLNDLTADEIAACDGALDIVVNVNNSENGLIFTDVAVKVPDEDERWMIFQYYRWTGDRKFYGTDVVQVWTPYRDLPAQWASYGEIAGRVMYDSDGVTYVSPYHSLDIKTYGQQYWVDEVRTVTDIFGTFSFPRNGKNCRGYIVYSTIYLGGGRFFNSFINYTHQDSLMQYPVITAYDNRISSWLDRKPFVTTQNQFSFEK